MNEELYTTLQVVIRPRNKVVEGPVGRKTIEKVTNMIEDLKIAQARRDEGSSTRVDS